MNSFDENYFAAIDARRHEAKPMQYRAVATAEWTPEPNQCHANVDHWVGLNPKLKAVRGWMIMSENDLGQCLLQAHSVVDENGELYDISVSDEAIRKAIRFLPHIGTDEEFMALQPHCSQVWYPLPEDEEIGQWSPGEYPEDEES